MVKKVIHDFLWSPLILHFNFLRFITDIRFQFHMVETFYQVFSYVIFVNISTSITVNIMIVILLITTITNILRVLILKNNEKQCQMWVILRTF